MSINEVLGFNRLLLPDENVGWDVKLNYFSDKNSIESYKIPLSAIERGSSFVVINGESLSFFPSFVCLEYCKGDYLIKFSTSGNKGAEELPESYKYGSLIVAPLDIKRVLGKNIPSIFWLNNSIKRYNKGVFVGRVKSTNTN